MKTGTKEKEVEQGVGDASLCLTLPSNHCVLAGSSPANAVIKRTHCVSMRVNPSELLVLKSDAKAHSRRMGEQLRHSYFLGQGGHVPAINQEAWGILAGGVKTLQDITLLVNTKQLPDALRPQLAELSQQIHELRKTLIGGTNEG